MTRQDRIFERTAGIHADWDSFLERIRTNPVLPDHARSVVRRALDTVRELTAQNRWDDIVDLLHPLEEKVPEAVEAGLAVPLAKAAAFALGRLGRHDDAIGLLQPLVRDNGDYGIHYDLGFLYAESVRAGRAKGSPPMTARERRARLASAHRHYQRCQELRPDGVSCFYRQGIVYREIEDKPAKALPLFERAVSNWRSLDDGQRRRRHQERPKYLRALYHLAVCHLLLGKPKTARGHLEALMAEEGSGAHVAAVFQHFTMGKCFYQEGRWDKAVAHVETAGSLAETGGRPAAFVWELAARCHLAAGAPEKALAAIARIPERTRPSYVRWTLGDALFALGRDREAEQEWRDAAERDRRGRHKALLRLCRLYLARGRTDEALEAARQAGEFFRHLFRNECNEARFWEAASLYAAGRCQEAAAVLDGMNLEYCRIAGLPQLRHAIHEHLEKEAA